jgi:acyl-CoA synthetase (AMP-forming)/AMP-acid ligase II
MSLNRDTSLIQGEARLVDAATGVELAGSDLIAAAQQAAEVIAGFPTGVAFGRMPNDSTAIVRYLGAWTAGRPVALLDPALAGSTLLDLVERFQPAVVFGLDAEPLASVPPVPAGYRAAPSGIGPVWVRASELDLPPHLHPHPDLAILLTTSGSTGNAKLVRLSRDAVLANARSIAEALRLGPAEVAPTTLSTFYSYGMSVVNSHLLVGATILVENGGMLQRPFWTAVSNYGVTSVAGVPYQYEMLRRLRFAPADYPSLRTLTQAGGRLRTEMVKDFHDRMAPLGGRFYVMYGQTEAAPRMTTLPAEHLAEKLGSVGPALPGGALTIRPLDGSREETSAAGVTGEVVYRGPNVMMGYAESVADLARGDDNHGVLSTGDLGYLDEDGYLFLQGRRSRIGKVFGVRLSLDDIETLVARWGTVAATGHNDSVVVWVEGADEAVERKIASELAERLNLHRSGFLVRGVEALPLLANGKVDYRALESQA